MTSSVPVTRADVVRCAREYIGTPWVHQHRSRGVAIDCAGLVICVARDLGLVDADFDITGYGRTPDGTLLGACDGALQRIEREVLQPGDVLALSFTGDPQHLAIVGDYAHGGLSIIHARNTGQPASSRVVENRLMWARNLRFVAAYALPGVQ
jgi:cell wall-associated NlpC family hydrolase